MASLRKKILSTYAFSKLVMLAFAVVVLLDLRFLEKHIAEGQTITALREAVLEMRREEKNFFLYGDRESLAAFWEEWQRAEAALARGGDTIAAIAGEARRKELASLLARYRSAMASRVAGSGGADASQEAIRSLGHALSVATQTVAEQERKSLAEASRRAGTTLLFAFAAVVLLGAGGGLFLANRVVGPLRRLQEGLYAIDEGRSRSLELPSRDSEIRAFVEAFNTMLRHLRQQQDQIRRNEKAAALGVLVSGVAHELNNPLANISTAAQLLIEEGETADQEMRQLWLGQIESETERARRIVRRLLDTVRHPKVHLQSVDASQLIQSALDLVERHLPEHVRVCVDAASVSELAVDRERMQQLLINLIRNAADAGAHHISVTAERAPWTEPGEEIHVEGDCTCLAQAGAGFCLTVEDDGPGIPPAMREHVFDPFFTTRAPGEGTGLGLYLVEEIVAEHKGCIWLDTGQTGGTRFRIWLPMEGAPRS